MASGTRLAIRNPHPSAKDIEAGAELFGGGTS
jgi:hypothetical protein